MSGSPNNSEGWAPFCETWAFSEGWAFRESLSASLAEGCTSSDPLDVQRAESNQRIGLPSPPGDLAARIPERHKSIGFYACASGNGCNPCEFFHRARSCKHGQQCAFCHLHKPRCSRNAVQRRRLKKHMLERVSDAGTPPSEGDAESHAASHAGSPSRAADDELETQEASAESQQMQDAGCEEGRQAAPGSSANLVPAEAV